MTALAEPVASASAPPLGGIHERVVAATLACIARHGLNKTTLDDVAREAGCSRASLYRYFDGKAELVATVVRIEAGRITDEIRGAAEHADTLEDAVVAMLETAGRELHHHPALGFVADFEPERLLPHLTFAGGARFLSRAGGAIAPALERFAPGQSDRIAEWVARVGLTLWMCPNGPVSLTDPVSLRGYVRAFVVPALERISPQPPHTFTPKR
jgi:TetR/AcrR family transcriptional regulator, repressor for uid operon